ncbi:MAG: hypothetical protein DLM73_16520 [Chthoniobacterales bacterium]|nr:MAG: hypothetical protein DLM73_16520 [Chthoniobacterales bacterium]
MFNLTKGISCLLVFAMLHTAVAQDAGIVERARLLQKLPDSASQDVSSDEIPSSSSPSSEDDSFGRQLILKKKERPRPFSLSGDAGIFFTNNAALTRHDKQDDFLFSASAALNWTRPLGNDVTLQLGGQTSIFRYAEMSSLDFESLGAGAGILWTPARLSGVSFAARYDFVELLNRHGRQVLSDHEFTLAAQKTFSLGGPHSLTLGAIGMVGLSDPRSAQRDLAGGFVRYQWQVSRRLETDVSYRLSPYFYNSGGRTDVNHVASWSVRYRFTPDAEVNSFLSFASNRSNRRAFNYDAVTTGLGVGFVIHF